MLRTLVMVTDVSEELGVIFSLVLDHPDLSFPSSVISVIPVFRRKFCMYFWCLPCMKPAHSSHPSSFEHMTRSMNREASSYTTTWTSPVKTAGRRRIQSNCICHQATTVGYLSIDLILELGWNLVSWIGGLKQALLSGHHDSIAESPLQLGQVLCKTNRVELSYNVMKRTEYFVSL
jgi:hypothetical protein